MMGKSPGTLRNIEFVTTPLRRFKGGDLIVNVKNGAKTPRYLQFGKTLHLTHILYAMPCASAIG